MKAQTFSDKVSIGISFLCGCHCLFLPLALIAFPVLTNFSMLADESLHIGLVALVLPISVFALWKGVSLHKDKITIGLILIGLSTLSFTAFFGHDIFGHTVEALFTVVSSLAMAYGHFRNFQLTKSRRNSQVCTNINLSPQ